MIRLARLSSTTSLKSNGRPALVDLPNRIVLASRARALSTAGVPGSSPEGDGIHGPLISDKGLQVRLWWAGREGSWALKACSSFVVAKQYFIPLRPEI